MMQLQKRQRTDNPKLTNRNKPLDKVNTVSMCVGRAKPLKNLKQGQGKIF